MANEQMPFKKRTNPLSGMSLGSIASIKEEVEAEEEAAKTKPSTPKVKAKETTEKTKVVDKKETSFQEETKQTVQKPAPKVAATKAKEVIRDKYTATMERSLRIDVKIASAKKGLQFSQYIEEAVREKLEREGL